MDASLQAVPLISYLMKVQHSPYQVDECEENLQILWFHYQVDTVEQDQVTINSAPTYTHAQYTSTCMHTSSFGQLTSLRQSAEQADLITKLSALGGMNMVGETAELIKSKAASSFGGVVV